MDIDSKELLSILIAILILGLSVAYLTQPLNYIFSLISFFIIIFANVIAKKAAAHRYDIKIKIKPWSIYRFGLRNDAHFKDPVPMVWVPILFTLLTSAKLWWLAILQFDSKAKPERVSRRHGYYRFSEVTEWDVGLIAFFGVLTNVIIAIICYLINLPGFIYFAELNIYYAAWSLVPISNLDGSKILFTSRFLWLISAISVGLLVAFISSI